MAWEKAFWNGLETKARKVQGVVRSWEEGDALQAWWKDFVGETVNAVEVVLDGVNYGGGVACMFEGTVKMPAVPEYGIESRVITYDPWYKVTIGHGSPNFPHADIPLIPETIKDRE